MGSPFSFYQTKDSVTLGQSLAIILRSFINPINVIIHLYVSGRDCYISFICKYNSHEDMKHKFVMELLYK